MVKNKEHEIPLEQRFQKAVVHKVTVSVLELILPKEHWAKWARVYINHLPEGKSLDDFSEGEQCEVFLYEPIDQDYYHGSLLWAHKKHNPWYQTKPVEGNLYNATALRYLKNKRGVFVLLDDSGGLDALLFFDEVPGNELDISKTIEIGDRIVVKVTRVNTNQLQVRVSIKAALENLKQEESNRRNKDFQLETIRLIPRHLWGLERKTDYRLAILASDIPFATHLQLWLEVFSFSGMRLNNMAHLERVLKANNRPSHIICCLDSWFKSTVQNQITIEKSLKQYNISLIWLRSTDSNQNLPFNAPELKLPVNLIDLSHMIQDPNYQVKITDKLAGNQIHDNFQVRHLQHLATDQFEIICKELHLDAAIWVAREREGVYKIRARSSSLDDKIPQLKILQPNLAQTVIADSIEQEVDIVWPVYKSGPIQNIVPRVSDRIMCIPIIEKDSNGNKLPVSRCVAFFYRSNQYRDGTSNDYSLWPVIKSIKPYKLTMETLLHTLSYAEHNESLSAFADLGRNAASYLHELGQKALPLQEIIDKYQNESEIKPGDWRKMRQQIMELIKMSRYDLSRIRMIHNDWLSLKTRLQRLVELYFFRFNSVNCAFFLEMPDFPMALKLNPLVVDQVISNILDNALYFAQQQKDFGLVTIKVFLKPDKYPKKPLIIEIEDNGSGISASMADYLFVPRRSGKKEGSGMGLFIARGFIQELGGDLVLKETSIRWRKTIFQVRLPVQLSSGGQS